jgi:hypothetical protein
LSSWQRSPGSPEVVEDVNTVYDVSMTKTTLTPDDILEKAKEVVEEVVEHVSQDEDPINTRVDPILSKSVSGYIAFTDGGWDGELCYPFQACLGDKVPWITPDKDRDRTDAETQFREKHELTDEDDIFEHPEWEEFITEWEQADTDTWAVYVRAIRYLPSNCYSSTGEEEYDFCMAVNDDYNYGRDSIGWLRSPAKGGPGSHWFFSRTRTVAELQDPEEWAALVKDMKQAWDDLLRGTPAENENENENEETAS